MRSLGIDYGRRRIGLALSDPSMLLATPFDVIENKGVKKTVARLVEIIKQNDVGIVVMGLPLHVSGGESEMSKEVREFGAALQLDIDVAIEYLDERWTSMTAVELIREGRGRKRKNDANLIDKVAASVILQTYLDERRKRT